MYCTKCGKEIADNAVMCPQCGTVPTSEKIKTKKNRKAVKVLLVVFGVIIFFSMLNSLISEPSDKANYLYDEVSDDSQTEKPIVDISVAELLDAYDKNELSANIVYKGTKVRTTGYISSISASGTSYATVYINAGDNYVLSQEVYFSLYDDDSLRKLNRMSEGDKITIVGTCKGEDSWSLTSDIEISDAVIE